MWGVASASVSSSSRGDSWVKLRARIALTDLDRAGVVAPLGVDVGPDAEQVRHGADHLTVVLRICFPLRALLTLLRIHEFACPLIMQNRYESLISTRNVLKPLIIFVTATRFLRPILYRTAENKSNYFWHVSMRLWFLAAHLSPEFAVIRLLGNVGDDEAEKDDQVEEERDAENWSEDWDLAAVSLTDSTENKVHSKSHFLSLRSYFVPPLSTISILRLVSSSCFLVIWFVRELSSDSRFVTFSARGARRNLVLKTTQNN